MKNRAGFIGLGAFLLLLALVCLSSKRLNPKPLGGGQRQMVVSQDGKVSVFFPNAGLQWKLTANLPKPNTTTPTNSNATEKRQ